MFKTLEDLQAHLDSLGLFRMKPGLERISAVLARLGLLRPPFLVIQVVGTNGKGSTSSFLAYLAQSRGLNTGLHTSPHFVSFRERIRMFGATAGPGHREASSYGSLARPDSLEHSFMPEESLLQAANEVMRAGGAELSYFEFLTALALAAFRLEKVEVAVLESGLGGLFDATTAIKADYVVFTPIAMDHCDVLGSTLAAIARDKAGAMRPNRPAFSCAQPPEARLAMEETAAHNGVELVFYGPESLEELPEAIISGRRRMRLRGGHQMENAALALSAWREIARREHLPGPHGPEGEELLRMKEEEALVFTRLPGRFQVVPPQVGYPLTRPSLLLDGAHNTHGMAALGLELARQGIAPGAVVFACLADKDPSALAANLRALSGGPVFVPNIRDNPRAMPAEDLAQIVGMGAVPTPDLAEALQRAVAHVLWRHAAEALQETNEQPLLEKLEKCPPVLICGSLYLLGEFFTLFPELL